MNPSYSRCLTLEEKILSASVVQFTHGKLEIVIISALFSCCEDENNCLELVKVSVKMKL